MSTSDERREVAERLRENATKRGVVLDYLGSEQVSSWWLLLHSIGCDSNHQEVAFNRIADLIDPTCEVVGITSDDVFCGTIYHHELSCGHTCDTGWPEPPDYCPYCGARVVEQ